MPRSGTLLRSGKHAICSRRSTVYSTFPVSHSAEFCLFEAVHPLPFGHPLLQGGTRFTFISKLCGASDFYAPHHHFAFRISHFSFKEQHAPKTIDSLFSQHVLHHALEFLHIDRLCHVGIHA